MSLTTVEEREYMSHVPYVSAVAILMYAMVCTRPDLSQVVSMVSKYMHGPSRGHWEAVKLILRYIKCTIDVGLVFEKDTICKQECIRMSILIMQETSTSASQKQGMCLHCLKHR